MNKSIAQIDLSAERHLCKVGHGRDPRRLIEMEQVLQEKSADTNGMTFVSLEKLTMNGRHLFTRDFWLSIVGKQAIDFLLDVG